MHNLTFSQIFQIYIQPKHFSYIMSYFKNICKCLIFFIVVVGIVGVSSMEVDSIEEGDLIIAEVAIKVNQVE